MFGRNRVISSLFPRLKELEKRWKTGQIQLRLVTACSDPVWQERADGVKLKVSKHGETVVLSVSKPLPDRFDYATVSAIFRNGEFQGYEFSVGGLRAKLDENGRIVGAE
ncbi:MAG: hypothetical protein QW356_02125 [Candidatus Hadarchaeales archaeon]